MTKNTSLEICPIARSLSVLGDAWSMLILRDAHFDLLDLINSVKV
jgi:DNA-binding HxlR family transcriptional regulator